MIELNTNNFDNTILKSNKLILVDFWSDWCVPCRMITPILEEISKDYMDKIIVTKCNVDDYPTIASKYSVRNIPTVLFFKNGSVIDTQIGAATKISYVNKINTLI